MAIRVFVGTPASNEDLECQAVLNWSLRKNTSADVGITWMMLSRDPKSFWYSDPQAKPRKGWNTRTWTTPFSALRWAVPAACNFEGKAIYMDCDTIVQGDIADLWNEEFKDKAAIISKANSDRFCVCMFDCAKAKKILPQVSLLRADPSAHRTARKLVQRYVQPFSSGDWNCVDGEGYKSLDDPKVKVIHYSAIPTQPNHKHARKRLSEEGKRHWFAGPDRPHPRKEITKLFDKLLEEATEAGYGPETFRVNPEFGNYGR